MRLIDADAANIYLNSTGVEMIKDMPGIDLPEGYGLEQVKELVEADKESRCIILSEIKDIEKIPKKEVVATCDIKYCLDYGEYIIGYLFKNNLSDTGYSCENDYDTMLDVTHYGMLPKIVKEGEE